MKNVTGQTVNPLACLMIDVTGKTTQNGSIESFNGKLRDECLNQHWFRSVAEARNVIKAWQVEYNQEGPHSSLSNKTPLEYAASLAI